MRILIVSQYFWPENFRVNDLVLGLKELGHEVVVLTGRPNYPQGRFFPGYSFFSPNSETFHGVRVVRVPLISRGDSRGLRIVLNYVSFAIAASIVAPFRCRGPWDAIFVNQASPIISGLPAITMRVLTKAPLFFWVLDIWPESLKATGAVKSPRVVRWVGRLVRLIYSQCDYVLVQSKAFFPQILKYDVPEKRIRYFPSWAEELFRPILKEEAKVSVPLPDGFRILFAGNLGASQGLETILDAAERLRHYQDIQWLVVGDGRQRSWLEAEVGKRELRNLHVLGQFPLETMPHFFAMADVLLATLRKEPIFALTIPGKIQAYMASGKPIIAAIDGETAEILKDAAAGEAVPAGDGESLAAAVLRLRRLHESERREMGQRARLYYEHNFQRTVLFDRLLSWMREAADRRKAFASEH